VAVGLNPKKSPKVWTAMIAPGWSLFRYGLCMKTFRIPGATAKGGKKFSIIQKVPAENLRDAENEMNDGYLFEDIHAEPFAEFHHTFLVARGAKMPSFTRKRQQVSWPQSLHLTRAKPLCKSPQSR
jgi:hypothetical protein